MISLEKYLEQNEKEHRFTLPMSFWSSLRLDVMKNFCKLLPFADRLFISSENNVNMYWEIILHYIKEKTGAKFYQRDVFYNNQKILNGAQFILEIEENEKEKKFKGSGQDFESRDIAISKALGEFLERYSSGVMSADVIKKLKPVSIKDIQKHAKIHIDYHGFSERQLEKNKRFRPSIELLKTLKVQNFVTAKYVDYPAQQIFWHSVEYFKQEQFLGAITSSGCAGGFTKEDAIVSAILEIVERDSFLCYWLTKTTPAKIIFEKGENQIYDRVKYLADKNLLDIHLLNTTTEIGIPTVVVVCVDKVKGGVCVSASSGFDFVTAYEKALLEICACLGGFGAESDYKLADNYEPFITKGVDRENRLSWWRGEGMVEKIKFFIQGKEEKVKEIEKASFENFLEKNKTEKVGRQEVLKKYFKERGDGYEDIYIYEYENEVIRNVGFYVARAIIPKMFPLYLAENKAFTNSKRLNEFYKWKSGQGHFSINQTPHPFP